MILIFEQSKMRVYTWRKGTCHQLVLVLLVICLFLTTIEAFKKKIRAKKSHNPKELPDAVLIDPVLKFGSRLMRSMNVKEKNIVFSPVSIHNSLSLAFLGATNGSETEKEMALILNYGPCEKEGNRVLEAYTYLMDRVKKTLKKSSKKAKKIEEDEAPNPKLDIWTMAIASDLNKADSEKPKQTYLDSINKYFKSNFRTVNQKDSKSIDLVVGEINKSGKESGFSSDLVEASEFKDENFKMMLASAVRVEAFWFENFLELIGKDVFYNYGKNSVDGKQLSSPKDIEVQYVEFSSSNTKKKYSSSESFKELAPLSYLGVDLTLKGDVTLAIFMPTKHSTGNELAELEKELLSSDENGMLNLCKTFQVLDKSEAKTTLRGFYMPKFTIDDSMNLVEPLKSMGMKRMFDENKAEFQRIYNNVPVHVSQASHKAMIEVNEEGLKASGFTKITVSTHSTSPSPTVKVDHPFLFVVRFNRVPMFLGHLVKLEK